MQDVTRLAKYRGRLRRGLPFALLSLVALVAACDPASLIREKVPEPIQDLLQFTPRPKTPGKVVAGVPQVAKVEIAQPRGDSMHLSGKEILFQGLIAMPQGEQIPPGQPDWTLFKDQENRPIPLGKGLQLKKPLAAGNYRIELSLDYQHQRTTKKLNFRVIYAIVGTLRTRDGQPIPGAELVLSNLVGKDEISRATSAKDGNFVIEAPPEGRYLLEPRKQGVGFDPYMKIVAYDKELTPLQFTGTNSAVKDVLLTASKDGKDPLSSVCPFQEGYLRFAVEGEMKPTRVEAYLVHIDGNELRRVEFDDVERLSSGEAPSSPDAPQWLKVKVPGDLKIGAKPVSFRVAVVARDQQENVITAAAPEEVTVNQSACFAARLAEAVALQEKGDLTQAIALYDSIDRVFKKLEDPAPLAVVAERAQFNRGLAHLAQGLSMPQQDPKYREALGRALSEFSGVLKSRPKDAQALLMRGTVKELMQNHDSARDDFTAALALDPKMYLALELRARALLATKARKNLSPALDDLTEAITLSPSHQELRKTRRETLKLIAATRDDKEDGTVDAAKVPLGEIAKMVNVAEYIRK